MDANRWMAQHDSLLEQCQNLDLKVTKAENHCEVRPEPEPVWEADFFTTVVSATI